MTLVAWCLFSFNGQISRKPFVLGFILCVCVSALTQPIVSEMFFDDRPIWTRHELLLAQGKTWVANSFLTLWPVLALYTKRLRDTGLPAWTLLVAMTFAGSVTLLQTTTGLVLTGAGFLFLVLVPSQRFNQRV